MEIGYISNGLGRIRKAIGHTIVPTLLALAVACGRGESVPLQSPTETPPKNDGYTLVLVDFNDGESRLPDGTIIGYLIDNAIKNRVPIVTVEWGETWRIGEFYRSKLEEYPYNTFIEKDSVDGFSNPKLEDVLKKIGNQKLVMVGGLGEICLNATIRSAIDRSYDVFASDETSIESSDSVHNSGVHSDSELATRPVNSYKGRTIWDRLSASDYRKIITLVGGDFELRERVYRKTVEKELELAQTYQMSSAQHAAEAYAKKLGIELPIESRANQK